MKSNFKEASKFILHILLTALASALVAMLQSYIASHGVDAGPTITPENTALIGTGMATLTKGIRLV